MHPQIWHPFGTTGEGRSHSTISSLQQTKLKKHTKENKNDTAKYTWNHYLIPQYFLLFP